MREDREEQLEHLDLLMCEMSALQDVVFESVEKLVVTGTSMKVQKLFYSYREAYEQMKTALENVRDGL